VDGGMLWRNGSDGKVLRYGAGERHQQWPLAKVSSFLFYSGVGSFLPLTVIISVRLLQSQILRVPRAVLEIERGGW
jgi:hypothetical protein